MAAWSSGHYLFERKVRFMHKGKKILKYLRVYIILFLCISLNGIGFLIGGWLYYREALLTHKNKPAYPFNKVNHLSGDIAVYSD